MSDDALQSLARARFHQPDDTPEQAAHGMQLLRLLRMQDGSTTRLCEAQAGGPVALHLLRQRIVPRAPADVSHALPDSPCIERWTCLAAHGQVMMDNLSYILLDGLSDELRHALEGGTVPIGHLLQRLWVRRAFFEPEAALLQRLWSVVGLPDAAASRAYVVVTPEGPRMLIAETFRRGMWMARGDET